MYTVPTMIQRKINIQEHLEPNKVLIIYGPRQVGKTTLVNEFLKITNLPYKFFTGDDLEFSKDFAQCDMGFIKKLLGNTQLLVVDEAHKIENIGRALKLTVDTIPGIYVISTGSSSFDLSNATDEPLTGRKNVVHLYPLSLGEITSTFGEYEVGRTLNDYLIYGMYPNVITYPTYDQKRNRITEIANAYLIKDILEFDKVKKSKVVIDLLKLLAFQIGNEVSTKELADNLGLDGKTVKRYLDLLEKSFVVMQLTGFSRNLRSEINKMSKYYFYDLGIRNALIANFNSVDLRDDVGHLWENFAIMERIKANSYNKVYTNYYFWRTYEQKEIDLVEERGGNLYGYEMKWSNEKIKAPEEWLTTYANASYEVITSNNYQEFLLK